MNCPICQQPLLMETKNYIYGCAGNVDEHEAHFSKHEDMFWIFYQNVEIGYDARVEFPYNYDTSDYYLRLNPKNPDYMCIPPFQFQDALITIQRYLKMKSFL